LRGMIELIVKQYIASDTHMHEPSLNAYLVVSSLFRLFRCKKILDVGSGYGFGSYIIKLLNDDAIVTGVDISDDRIEHSKSKFSEVGLSFIKANIVSKHDWIKRVGKGFDCVSCIEVFEHIPPEDIVQCLSNIRQATSHKAVMVMTTPNKYIYDVFSCTQDHINEVTPSILLKILRENGFKVIKVYGLGRISRKYVKLVYKHRLHRREERQCLRQNTTQKIIWHIISLIFNPTMYIPNILSRILKYDIIKRKARLRFYNVNQEPYMSEYVMVIAMKRFNS